MGSLRDVPHAAVIGAGPAGCAAARQLAASGWRVTIFERAVFPRVKVCGEFVSPAATDVLESILPAATLLHAGAKRVQDVVLVVQGRSREWQMPEPAWALSRAGLDTLLLEAARQAGAEVRCPASVRDVEYGAAGVTVVLADGERVAADIVIHADGVGRFDPAGPTPAAPGLVGMKCHLRLPPGRSGGALLTMRSAPGAYVGTVGVEAGLATCALVACKALVNAAGGDGDALLARVWPEFRPAWREGEWKASAVARGGYREPGDERSFRVGNAAGAVDPVGGEGIGLALWSGRRLGEMLAARPGAWRELQREFAASYRRRLRVRRWGCRVVAEIMMRPRLAGMLWPVAARPKASLRAWYALTGKG
ncbi:MAG: FAD-dependent oxidoreductase [Tepidisphaera sp.]|nr:FAD-dependent oxidoreductase [Tepidisphaera sp.]